ncbi:MAG: hypothetical protein FWG07_02505 [Treponema sp.]|nr:hypothetical protein [Treponema sp.]
MDKKKSLKKQFFKDLLSDRLSDTWKLLSETTGFLSKTPVFLQYEEELRSWRYELQNANSDGETSGRIRQKIVYLRKSLREQGYDLSLARQNLILDGFRNDASLGKGFRRVVIYFGEDDIYWFSGDDNHITLAEILDRQLAVRTQKQSCKIRSKHYLWYRRKGNDLVLSGSDTETKEDFIRLKAMAEANSLVILAKLRRLK